MKLVVSFVADCPHCRDPMLFKGCEISTDTMIQGNSDQFYIEADCPSCNAKLGFTLRSSFFIDGNVFVSCDGWQYTASRTSDSDYAISVSYTSVKRSNECTNIKP